jgi:hypothetical protein
MIPPRELRLSRPIPWCVVDPDGARKVAVKKPAAAPYNLRYPFRFAARSRGS